MTIRESVIDMDFEIDEIVVISDIPYEITDLEGSLFYAEASMVGFWVSIHDTDVIRITKESEIITDLLNDI